MKKENFNFIEAELLREYRGLRGMSLSGDPCPTRRFAYAINMYVDRDGGGDGVESIPGFRKIHIFDGDIHSIAIQTVGREKFLLIHAKDTLYRLAADQAKESSEPTVIAKLKDNESHAFAFGSVAFITDGAELLAINDQGEARRITNESYITGCSLCALYDGRLFMSGNPNHPNEVFRSSPICEGEISFDGGKVSALRTEGAEVVSLLSFGGRLWVFKSTDGGEGSILSYRAVGEGYCLCIAFGGYSPTGQVLHAGGKIIFLSGDGLFAIERPICDERAFVKRLSADIDPLLLREDIESASLTFWQGYVAIGCGERIYLCDTEGDEGCDWYIISGVGGHVNDRRVYRYLDSAEEGYFVHTLKGKPAEREVFSVIDEDKRKFYYTEEDGKRYAVYPTEQLRDGDLLPARELISDGRLLWFYSAGGRLYLFNNDKRGEPPEKIKSAADFNGDEYSRLYGRRLHPDFYSFDGHAPSYMLMTQADGCGLTDLVKSSQGNSLTLRLKNMSTGILSVDVITDGRSPVSQLLRFSSSKESAPRCEIEKYARRTIKHSLCERTPVWQEKQICLYTKEFASPFGLCSISFRYKPKETLKKG